jgi:hypothetical protein
METCSETDKKDYRYCSGPEYMSNSDRNPGTIYPQFCPPISINMRTVFSVFSRVPYFVEETSYPPTQYDKIFVLKGSDRPFGGTGRE